MRRGENLRKHGLTGTPEHRAWISMMTRCRWAKPGDRNYALYQGAGVIVCDRWNDFATFLADMGKKPSPKHSLDRFPNTSGSYEPSNCRWATAKQQARNWKDRNVRFEHAGEALTLSEWAERLGVARGTLQYRVESGWPLDRALTASVIRNRERMANGSFAPFGG